MKGKLYNDKLRRIVANQHELLRNTLRYVTHTEAIPLSTRYIAQFKLAELPRSSNMDTLARRCVLSGRGRGMIGEFNLSRIMFRKLALEGKLPGVKKSTW